MTMSGALRLRERDVEIPAVPRLLYVRDAFARSVAVVMGVDGYDHGIPRLKTPVADAEAVAALLETEHGFVTVLRRDAEVTVDRVRALFDHELASALGGPLVERDRLLVYFAGHGLSMPSERGPEGKLLLADANLADRKSLFAMSELRALIGALPCRHVLIVLDCCFAGTFRWAGKRDDRGIDIRAYRETLERFVTQRAWQVLVSAAHDQTAADTIGPEQTESPTTDVIHTLGSSRLENEQHSPFAAAFLRSLRGEADYTRDGLIVAREFELFVRDTVEQATHVRQTPQLYKLDEHDRGEFVFQVPGTTLALEPAPALSVDDCPYQGLRPYGSTERDRFFGRTRVVAALLDRVKTCPLTVVLGPSGAGKSSVLAAGIVPAVRDLAGWTVVETRLDATSYEAFRDAIPAPAGDAPGKTLLARVTAWLSAQADRRLCLAIDHVERLEMLVEPKLRDRVLGELSQALAEHGARLRVVLALRSEFEPVFRVSALQPFWAEAVFVLPALAQDELREIIERPARAIELAFDPPALIDTLINEIVQAPGGLPLLSFALRELYVRCARRNTDRLLTEHDYASMGRLSGALAQRASELLGALIAEDPEFEATARRVFLRMVVSRDREWIRRRVHRDELVFQDGAENQRVVTLLARFCEARLVVLDKDEWEPAHNWLVLGWPQFTMWRAEFDARAFVLQTELAEAARRWRAERRAAYLWPGDHRLRDAVHAMRAEHSWLNALERGFVTASLCRRRGLFCAVLAAAVLVAVTALVNWDFKYRMHADYYRDHVRRWGEPQGVGRLSDLEASRRALSVKLVRRGRDGHVVHVELVRGAEVLACDNQCERGDHPESGIGEAAEGKRMLCQWDFAYESEMDMVSTETARDRAGRVVYRLQYRSNSRERRKAGFYDENGDDARIIGGGAELVEFVRSPDGFDIEKHYLLQHGEPARNQDGISIEKFNYDERGNQTERKFYDETDQPMRSKDGIAGWQAKYDEVGNETERRFLDETGKRTRDKDGVAGWQAKYDEVGNETLRRFVDEASKPTRNKDGVAGWRAAHDERGNCIERTVIDEGEPMPGTDSTPGGGRTPRTVDRARL